MFSVGFNFRMHGYSNHFLRFIFCVIYACVEWKMYIIFWCIIKQYRMKIPESLWVSRNSGFNDYIILESIIYIVLSCNSSHYGPSKWLLQSMLIYDYALQKLMFPYQSFETMFCLSIVKEIMWILWILSGNGATVLKY